MYVQLNAEPIVNGHMTIPANQNCLDFALGDLDFALGDVDFTIFGNYTKLIDLHIGPLSKTYIHSPDF